MMSYRHTTLGEVADINPKADWNSVNQLPVVSFVPMAAVSDSDYCLKSVQERPLEEVRKGFTYFQRGDVLLAKITPCFENGKVALAEIPQEHGFGSTEFHVIRAKEGTTHPRFLYYMLRRTAFLAEGTRNMTGSAGQKRVPKLFLENFPLALPSLEQQQRIVDTLDKADALRRKDQKLLLKYDELAQSVFYEMFGDPELNTKGWSLQPLGTLINAIKSGTSLGGEDRELLPGEFGVLKVSAVTTGIFKAEEYKVPAQADIVKEKVTVLEGDLLFSRANTRELVGAVAIAEHTYPNLMLPDKLWRLDLHPDQMRKHYCKAILSDPSIRYSLTKTATGTSGSMLNISMAKLRDLEVPVPPVELQMEFEEVAKKLLKQKRIAEKAVAQSEQLFTSLLDSYFV